MSWSPAIASIAGAIVAALTTVLLVPSVVRAARRSGRLDRPGGRKRHERAVPRIGGVAIFCGLGFGAAAASLLLPPGTALPGGGWLPFAGAATVLFLVGLVDDLRGLSALSKLLFQAAAALAVVAAGWRPEFVVPAGGSLGPGLLTAALTVAWIVVVTNAFNLIDGLDGLATGAGAILGGSLWVIWTSQGPPGTVILAAVAGACCGFLPYNREPATVFLGDSGSQVLGFAIGSATALAPLDGSPPAAFLVPLLALGVPIVDAALVALGRFRRPVPNGKLAERVSRILQADRSHFHHALEVLLSRRAAVRVAWILIAVSCAAAGVVARTESVVLGIALFVLQVLAVLVLRSLAFARRERDIAGFCDV